MSKGLEALKVLVMSCTTLFNTKEQITNAKETIEKELKEGEKNKQALEIIKKKSVDVINLKSCFKFYYGNDEAGLEDYNKTKDKNSDSLTEEEYDLLKEVLL